ncbi:MAG: hypothetical protein CL609_22945 [Anaerolineaceae bacterium]|nr:hypothetical protein [Anaerolineaceae bacterium]
MCTFNNWLKQYRETNGFSLEQIKVLTGVDRSTLFRIENEITSLNLVTVNKIYTGLSENDPEVSIPDLLNEHWGISLKLNKELKQNYFSQKDVLVFTKIFLKNNIKANDILANLWNLISQIDLKTNDNNNSIFYSLYSRNSSFTFTRDDVAKYFLPSRIFKFKIDYPDIHFKEISKKFNFYFDRSTSPDDIGYYFRELIQEKKINKNTIELKTSINFNTLGRIERGETISQKIDDIVNIDKTIKADANFFTLAWLQSIQQIRLEKLFEELELRLSRPDLHFLLSILLKSIRWLEYSSGIYLPEDEFERWLFDFRGHTYKMAEINHSNN